MLIFQFLRHSVDIDLEEKKAAGFSVYFYRTRNCTERQRPCLVDCRMLGAESCVSETHATRRAYSSEQRAGQLATVAEAAWWHACVHVPLKLAAGRCYFSTHIHSTAESHASLRKH